MFREQSRRRTTRMEEVAPRLRLTNDCPFRDTFPKLSPSLDTPRRTRTETTRVDRVERAKRDEARTAPRASRPRNGQPRGDDNGDEGGASVHPPAERGWLACLRGNYKHVLTEHYDHTRTRATHTDRGEGGREGGRDGGGREGVPLDSFRQLKRRRRKKDWKSARRGCFFRSLRDSDVDSSRRALFPFTF